MTEQEVLKMVLEEFAVAEKEVNKDELNWNFAKEIINNLTGYVITGNDLSTLIQRANKDNCDECKNDL